MALRNIRPARPFFVLAAVALAAATLVVAPSASASALPSRVSYPGAVPAIAAKASPSTVAGPAAAADEVEGSMYLYLQHAIGATDLATAVSNPANPAYGKYVTPAQWIDKYSPSVSDFTAVEKYLKDSGFTIYATPASRLYVVFMGPAGLFGSAFRTSIRNYRYGGRTVTAPATAPSLPAAIASKVSGLRLGNSSASVSTAKSDGAAEKEKAAAPTFSCSQYWAQNSYKLPKAYGRTTFPTNNCGYTPQQMRSSASLTSSETGKGQTVGIVDAYASPTIVQDSNTYSRAVGAPAAVNIDQIKPKAFINEAECQYPSGWQTEETLDVESVHGVAPGAKIVYSGGFDCIGGLDIAVSKILDSGLATIISNSYSDGPDALVPTDYINGVVNEHLQAAAEGIGMYYSTGDDGDNAAADGVAGPGFAASSPWATAVGGTSLAVGASGKYLFETGWGDYRDQVVNGKYVEALPGDFYAGAGGGQSAQFTEPSYQDGVVPTSLSTNPNGIAVRVAPDISDDADPYTGFLIGIRPIVDDSTLQTGPFEEETYGGTSLASPLVAAKMAILQQKTGRRIGFANPLLYSVDRSSPAAFHDVNPTGKIAVARLSPSLGLLLVTLNEDTSLVTTKGYDTTTGIGTLNLPEMLKVLS